MCKISVWADAGRTERVIKKYSEEGDGGCGYFVIRKDGSCVFQKGIDIKEIEKKLLKENDGKLFIYHSRIPSIGIVSNLNCQPFYDAKSRFLLAHNGTIPMLSLAPLAFSTNANLPHNTSDSRLLFEIFRKIDDKKRIFSLKIIDGNFVYLNLNTNKIYLVGRWEKDKMGIVHTTNGWNKRMLYGEDINVLRFDEIEVETPTPYAHQPKWNFENGHWERTFDDVGGDIYD